MQKSLRLALLIQVVIGAILYRMRFNVRAVWRSRVDKHVSLASCNLPSDRTELTIPFAGFSHGRALLALDSDGKVPNCYNNADNFGVPNFDWEAALGPSDKFDAAVRATCPPNSKAYYCYGTGNKAYKGCILGRFPADQCKLEDQCVADNITPPPGPASGRK